MSGRFQNSPTRLYVSHGIELLQSSNIPRVDNPHPSFFKKKALQLDMKISMTCAHY